MIDTAGRRAFHGVTAYTRVTVLIALIDAAGNGIGLVALGVPLPFALSALVFLGAFVPYVGAFVSGLLSIGVALVSNGPVTALAVLGVVVGVRQLEGHLLQLLLASLPALRRTASA